MSPPPSLSKTTFFSRPTAHSLKIRKQNRLSNTKKKRNHTNIHIKSKQKSKSNTPFIKTKNKTPQKDNPKQSTKLIQLENTPNKHPHKLPSKTIHPKNAPKSSRNKKAPASRSFLKEIPFHKSLGNLHETRIRKPPKSRKKQQKGTKSQESKSSPKSATSPRIPPGAALCFFPSPSYKMHEKVCSFHKK